jgi:SAM-dependent methyltransferase
VRRESRSYPLYAVRAPLARWLEEQARHEHERRGRYRVLDVGSGAKPYERHFAPYADAYVGVDAAASADLVGRAEELPVEDASFDVVLCNQVLEHCDDPMRVAAELRRVVAPGGVVLASTHGVAPYHPNPDDLWRWPHAGLERLFLASGEWASVTVRPGSGTASCMTMLLAVYVDLAAKRTGTRALVRPVVAGLNALGEALDARSPALREPRPGSLIANYHVRAEVAR